MEEKRLRMTDEEIEYYKKSVDYKKYPLGPSSDELLRVNGREPSPGYWRTLATEKYAKKYDKPEEELYSELIEDLQEWANESGMPKKTRDLKGNPILIYPQSPEYWKKKPETKDKKDDGLTQ
jgi:hypothetical protein